MDLPRKNITLSPGVRIEVIVQGKWRRCNKWLLKKEIRWYEVDPENMQNKPRGGSHFLFVEWLDLMLVRLDWTDSMLSMLP